MEAGSGVTTRITSGDLMTKDNTWFETPAPVSIINISVIRFKAERERTSSRTWSAERSFRPTIPEPPEMKPMSMGPFVTTSERGMPR